MWLALSVALGASVFTTFVAVALFRYLRPEIVADDYDKCSNCWHEAHLNECEQGLLRVPQQPVNTYTNLAYLAAGVFLGALLGTPPSWVFAFVMAYLCVGSMLYHATSTRWAGMMDVTAIYAVFSALAVYAVAGLAGLAEWLTTALMFGVAGLAAYVLSPRYKRRMNLRIGIFLGLAFAVTLLHMWLSGRWAAWPYLLASALLFALGYGVWTLDRNKRFPLPRWGHGFWHLFTAAAAALVFYATHLTGA